MDSSFFAMKCCNFPNRKCETKSCIVRSLRTNFYQLLLTFTVAVAVNASTDSRVKFSSFELSPFDCTVAALSATSLQQQVSPYIVAEQVRSIAEDCLRIAVPIDCKYGSVDYIGLGNAVCDNGTITIRGGVMDFTSADYVPSSSEVAQCLRTAMFSTTCRDMIQSDFPAVTSLEYEYHTPAPAPVLASTESTNDEVPQPVLNETDVNTSQNSMSIATVLGVVGGGAVVVALLGFMAAVRQKKRGSAAKIRREPCCVRNPEDLESDLIIPVGCCDTKQGDEDDDAQTPTTLSLNDGSNSSFEDDLVVVNAEELDSCNKLGDPQVAEDSVKVDSKCMATAQDPFVVQNEFIDLDGEKCILQANSVQQNSLHEQPLLPRSSTAENRNRKDGVVDSMKSWMGFHLNIQHPNQPMITDAGEMDDFAPDDVWNPDDNSVSSVDLESLSVTGTGELSFAPSPPTKPTKEWLAMTTPSLKRENPHRRSQSVTELFPATIASPTVQTISTSNSMPSFEKWNVQWSANWKKEYESLDKPRPPPTPPRKYLAIHVCRPPKPTGTRNETSDTLENEI